MMERLTFAHQLKRNRKRERERETMVEMMRLKKPQQFFGLIISGDENGILKDSDEVAKKVKMNEAKETRINFYLAVLFETKV